MPEPVDNESDMDTQNVGETRRRRDDDFDKQRNTTAIWLEILNKFGFPVALVLLLLGGAGVALKWAAVEVVQPATATHLEFVKSVERSVEHQERSAEKQTEVLRELSALMAAQNKEQQETTEAIEGLVEEMRAERTESH